MNRLNIYERFNTYIYEIFLVLIVILHYAGILHTNSFLTGADIYDYVDLKSDTIQTAAFKSANLPVYYLFEFLYKGLGLSSEFIKAGIVLFCLVTITFSIYKITLYVFDNKLSGILAVILFLYSSLYYAVLFGNLNFIDESNPPALSYSFLMLGIFYWLKERYHISSIFMGLSFDCHPILPIGLIVASFTHQLINYRRIGVKDIGTSLLIFLIVTLPVTFGIVNSLFFTVKGSVAQELDAELIWRYVRFVQSQSAFIDIIPQFHYGLALYFSSFLFLLLLYNYGDQAQKERYFKLFLLVFTVFAFTIFELLNSYHFKIIPLYNLWLHRFMTYGSVITYIILAGGAFCTVREDRVNNLLRIGLFLLLCFSIFAQELHADLYWTFWANHFYILEIVIIYYLYNFYNSYSKNELPFKTLATNLTFLAGTLIYYYYVAIYDRFNPPPYSLDLFQWNNIKLFLKVVFYRQFEYASVYNFYPGFYVLLAFSVCLGAAHLLNLYNDVIEKEKAKHKMLFWPAVAGILLIVMLAGIRVVPKKDSPLSMEEKLYAVWTMDDIIGDNVKDAEGKHNATSFNTSLTEGHAGKKASYFNGKDSYIKTPVNFQGWEGFRISLWVYPEQKNEGGLAVILDNGHDADNNLVIQSADINNPSSDRWVFHCSGVGIPITLPFQQWTHIVVIADTEKGGIVQAYTNGVDAGKVTIDRKFEFGAVPLTIGRLATAEDRYFKGRVDEVIILERLLMDGKAANKQPPEVGR